MKRRKEQEEHKDGEGNDIMYFFMKDKCVSRRSVAASLVQGVYVVERDRQQNRKGSQALASPWWEFFNFQMLGQLKDNVDSSIFVAVYKFKPPASHSNLATVGCPCYVIAF
ncbi:hypothetical protein QYF36_004771 [Acer negundo]|nr:hypothetical protein QYF36_004771 [Acer negundo]